MDPLENIETNTDSVNSDPLKIIKNEIENTIKPESIDVEDERNKMKIQAFKSRSHKCSQCKSKFKYNCILIFHVQSNHKKIETTSVKCDFCKAVKNSKASMKMHIYKFHKIQDKKHVCDFCNKSFTLKSEFTQHKLKGHKPVDYLFERTCYNCDQVLKNKKFFVRHINEFHNELFQCKECNKEFHGSFKYFNHMRKVHSRKYNCTVCNGVFASKQVLERHNAVVHEKLKLFKCNLCPKTFSHQQELNDHTKTVHESRDYVCDLCSKSFSRKDVLLKHRRRSHLKIQPLNFECDICEKRFKDRDTLQCHMKQACKTGRDHVKVKVC